HASRGVFRRHLSRSGGAARRSAADSAGTVSRPYTARARRGPPLRAASSPAPRTTPRRERPSAASPRAASGPFSAQARNEPRPLPQPALLVFLDEPGVKAHRVLRHHRVLG